MAYHISSKGRQGNSKSAENKTYTKNAKNTLFAANTMSSTTTSYIFSGLFVQFFDHLSSFRNTNGFL